MPKRVKKATPTEEDIRSFDNVPCELAAAYLGTCSTTIKRAMQQGRTPFGWAARNDETGTYTYNISPGGLIRYKAEGFRTVDLALMEQLIQEAVDRLMDARMAGVMKALTLMEGGKRVG